MAYYISIKDSNLAATSQDNSALATKQINYNLLNIFNSYTYDKYSHNYAISSEQILNGKYTVKYLNLNAEFSYYNTDTNKRIIESATQNLLKIQHLMRLFLMTQKTFSKMQPMFLMMT